MKNHAIRRALSTAGALAAAAVLAATPLIPAQALTISGQFGDGLYSTIAQQENFTPLTNAFGTFDFASITFRNGLVGPHTLALDTPTLLTTVAVDMQVTTGNLNAPFTTGDRDVIHDFVYTNTLTLNGVTQTFMQDAHADFTANSTTDITMILDMLAVPLLTYDLGADGLLEVDFRAGTLTCGTPVSTSCGGFPVSLVYATLRAPGQASNNLPEPGTLAVLAVLAVGLVALG